MCGRKYAQRRFRCVWGRMRGGRLCQSLSVMLAYVQLPTGQIRIGLRLKNSNATCSLLLLLFCNHRFSQEINILSAHCLFILKYAYLSPGDHIASKRFHIISYSWWCSRIFSSNGFSFSTIFSYRDFWKYIPFILVTLKVFCCFLGIFIVLFIMYNYQLFIIILQKFPYNYIILMFQ